MLAYLARYTHRTAIANSRLVAADNDHVALSYKDYRRAGREGVMRLGPHEFIRRFLLHVLPDGFHRVRHYGFLARGDRGESLARVRALLEVHRTRDPADHARASATSEPEANADAREAFAVCPDCGGLMRRVGLVAPLRRLSLRHLMTRNASPNAIAVLRRAVTPTVSTIRASSGSMRLASASRVPPSWPLEALECPHPTRANPSNCASRRPCIAEMPASPEPTPRFPHSG